MQAVRVLNHITWNESAAFEHTTSVSADAAVIFAEVRDDSATDAEQLPHAANAADNGADADAAASRWRYEVQETSVEARPPCCTGAFHNVHLNSFSVFSVLCHTTSYY